LTLTKDKLGEKGPAEAQNIDSSFPFGEKLRLEAKIDGSHLDHRVMNRSPSFPSAVLHSQ
jgi:hypothetical protein